MPESESYYLNLLRHGQSTANAEPTVFEGGAPGDDVDLTAFGVRQSRAAGFATRRAGVTVGRLYGSEMPRAGHTIAEFALARALDVDGIVPLSGIQEVSHGGLELEGVSTATSVRLRGLSKVAMQDMLIRHGLTQGSAERYAPWLAFQGRGDGESYIEAGVRAWNALRDNKVGPDAVIAGHHGTWRSTVGLADTLTPTALLDISESLGAVTDQEVKATIVNARAEAGRELTKQELIAIFDPIAEEMVSIAGLLERLELPHFSNIAARPKLGNGSLLQVRVRPNGQWKRMRMIDPILLADDTEPTYDNVQIHITTLTDS